MPCIDLQPVLSVPFTQLFDNFLLKECQYALQAAMFYFLVTWGRKLRLDLKNKSTASEL